MDDQKSFEKAEKEVFDFFQTYVEENEDLIQRRIEEADGDLALASRTVAVDMMRDDDYPESSFFIISGGIIAAGLLASFTAGVIVGVVISKD